MSNYNEALEPLREITSIVFINHVEPKLFAMFSKYKESIFINESSNIEFTNLLKSSALIVKNYLSDTYYNHVLKRYFSEEGIVFLIITELSLKSRISHSQFLNKI